MGTETERRDTRMAMAYQLISVLEQKEDKTYTLDELKEILNALVNSQDK